MADAQPEERSRSTGPSPAPAAVADASKSVSASSVNLNASMNAVAAASSVSASIANLNATDDGSANLAVSRQARVERRLSVVDDGLNYLRRQVADAFAVFDHDQSKTVDVREIGTIVRSLGMAPTEAALHEIIAEAEEEEPTGFIKYEKFEPVMLRLMKDRKYQRDSEDLIMKAFQILDADAKGYLTTEELTRALTLNGEPFSQEEIDEMLTAAVDPEKGVIYYDDYAVLLGGEEYSG
eukprot:Opistho-2@4603